MQISSFLTLSKQTALSRHLEVTAENLANASTLGYRRTGIYFNSLMGSPTAGEDVSYPFEAESHVDFTEGAFQDTGNPLDLAILGNSEAFFVVAKDGELRITRNGNFLINTAGQLVTTTGETVLDDSSQPIRVNPGAQKLVVTEDGSIFSDDVRSGRVRSWRGRTPPCPTPGQRRISIQRRHSSEACLLHRPKRSPRDYERQPDQRNDIHDRIVADLRNAAASAQAGG